MNKYTKNGVRKSHSILLLFMLLLSNMLHSQETNIDTLAFSKAQQKFDSCRSGVMNYRLNYVTSNFELYWDIKLCFIKNDENRMFFYIAQREDGMAEDDMTNEYLYYNDTLLMLIYSNFTNEITYSKEYEDKPFEGNIKRYFTYLLDNHTLTNFLSYDSVKLYDTELSINQNNINVIVGEASSFINDVEKKLTADYYSKIILNKENNNLVSCFNQVTADHDGDFFHKASQEHLIDTIALYTEKRQDIEDKIKLKYRELDSIITFNIKPPAMETKQEEDDELRLKLDSIIAFNPEPYKVEYITDNSSTETNFPKYAYDWKLPLTNGDTLNSKDINSKILVLDFYYTGCAPCILAIKDLIKLDNLYNEDDVTFVGVNVADKDLIKINKFLEDKKVKYRNVVNGKELADKYSFNGFPQILFIDTKTNEILNHSLGYRSDGFEYYKELLDNFLEKINK